MAEIQLLKMFEFVSKVIGEDGDVAITSKKYLQLWTVVDDEYQEQIISDTLLTVSEVTSGNMDFSLYVPLLFFLSHDIFFHLTVKTGLHNPLLNFAIQF